MFQSSSTVLQVLLTLQKFDTIFQRRNPKLTVETACNNDARCE